MPLHSPHRYALPIPPPLRARRIDPRPFALFLPCPLCGYRIPPAQILRVGWDQVQCPACRHPFDEMDEKKPVSHPDFSLDPRIGSRVHTQLTMSSKREDVLTSGQLGTAAGVSADTIRHYEKLGLIAQPSRTAGGYRLYPAQTLLRVQTIRSALKAGFSLTELAGIFRERDSGGTPCQRVAGMASDKITALTRQISDLTELRDWLSATVANWNKRLEKTPSGKRAGLLESLAGLEPVTKHQSKGSSHERESDNSRISSSVVSRRIRSNRNGLSHSRSEAKRD